MKMVHFGGTWRWETLHRDLAVLKKVAYGQPYPTTPNTACDPRDYRKPLLIPIIILFWSPFLCQSLAKCSTYISSYACKRAIFLFDTPPPAPLCLHHHLHHKALVLGPLKESTLAKSILYPFLLLHWRVTAQTHLNLYKRYLQHYFAMCKGIKSTLCTP